MPKRIEQRLTKLERAVAALQARSHKRPDPSRPWWIKSAGRFANDPVFEEIARLGRRYRRSLKPK